MACASSDRPMGGGCCPPPPRTAGGVVARCPSPQPRRTGSASKAPRPRETAGSFWPARRRILRQFTAGHEYLVREVYDSFGVRDRRGRVLLARPCSVVNFQSMRAPEALRFSAAHARDSLRSARSRSPDAASRPWPPQHARNLDPPPCSATGVLGRVVKSNRPQDARCAPGRGNALHTRPPAVWVEQIVQHHADHAASGSVCQPQCIAHAQREKVLSLSRLASVHLHVAPNERMRVENPKQIGPCRCGGIAS